MKKSEFRNIIREEIKSVLNEEMEMRYGLKRFKRMIWTLYSKKPKYGGMETPHTTLSI